MYDQDGLHLLIFAAKERLLELESECCIDIIPV